MGIDAFHPKSQMPTAKGLTLRRPLRKKIADEVIFRRFHGEGVEFFLNRTSLTPLRFLMRIFWKIPIKALQAFIFQWVI